MLFKSVAALLALAGLVAAQSTSDLTHGAAKINMNNITATFTFDKVTNGVNITVNVASGLTEAFLVNKALGFDYHVHVYPVGPNNNCTATGAHLDPLKVGVAKPCDPLNLISCQEGDLSGKHGNLLPDISSDVGAIPLMQYIDTQLTFTGDGAITGRSVVIHNNGTRVACANLAVDGYVAPATATATATGAATTDPHYPLVSSSSSSSVGLIVGIIAAVVVVIGVVIYIFKRKKPKTDPSSMTASNYQAALAATTSMYTEGYNQTEVISKPGVATQYIIRPAEVPVTSAPAGAFPGAGHVPVQQLQSASYPQPRFVTTVGDGMDETYEVKTGDGMDEAYEVKTGDDTSSAPYTTAWSPQPFVPPAQSSAADVNAIGGRTSPSPRRTVQEYERVQDSTLTASTYTSSSATPSPSVLPSVPVHSRRNLESGSPQQVSEVKNPQYRE
ncbi:hypothetical protein BGZ98_005580 [Dissophora globulifera]|nr:hypothetical protein BGZ98_005580 [Dissophora globulifera]